MITQNNLLRFFKDRRVYQKYSKYLKERNFPSKDAWTLLQDFGAYFESFSDDLIDFDKFEEWFFQFRRPDLPAETRENIREALKLIKEPSDIEFSKEAIKSFKKQSMVDKLRDLVTTNLEVDLEKVKQEISSFEKDDVDLINNTIVNGSIKNVNKVSDFSNGFTWPLDCLNENLPSICIGVFGVIAALKGKGKSSLIAHTVANILRTQRSKLTGPILWGVNENNGETACFNRVYSSLFNLRPDQLREREDDIDKKITSSGLLDYLVCHNIHGMTYKDLDILIDYHKPSILVLDMIDYIKGFEGKSNVTSDQKYLDLYQWALNISAINCPVLATSQLSDEARGWRNQEYIPDISMYPDESFMQHSRNAKQSKAGFVLMLGHHEAYPNVRYLSAPRNKYGREGMLRHKVSFDGERSRFSEN